MSTEKSEVWVVIGNRMSWGKGDTFKEALAGCLKNASQTYGPTTVIWVSRLHTTQPNLIQVNELGGLAHPIDADIKQLPELRLPGSVVQAFSAFDEEVEELQYGRTMEVFDD